MSTRNEEKHNIVNRNCPNQYELLKTANDIGAFLLFSDTTKELSLSLTNSLPLMKRYLDVCEIHILQKQEEQPSTLTYLFGWYQKEEIDHDNIPIGKKLSYSSESKEELEVLQQDENYINHSIFKTKFADLNAFLNGQDKRAIIALPVFIDNNLWGYVVFASNFLDLNLNNNEIIFLNTVSTILISSINRISRSQKLSTNNQLLTSVAEVASVFFEELESDDIENIVYNCLRIIGEATNTDRVQNWKNEIIDGRMHFVLREEWMSEYGATKPSVPMNFAFPYDEIPGWEEMFARGESINCPISLLREKEQEILSPYGMISIVITPLFLRGKLWGFFSVDDCKRERYFSHEEMSILNSVGFMMISALEQTRMVSDIKYRDSLYDLVNRVANLLEYSEGMNFELCLYQSLELMAGALNVERANIWVYNEKDNKLFCAANYQTSNEIKPIHIGYEGSVIVRDTLMANIIMNVRVKDLSKKEYDYFTNLSVKSFLILPIFINGEFWGGLAFADCKDDGLFLDDEITILRSAGYSIANALQRNKFLENIKETSTRLEIALNEARTANNIKTDFLANMSHEMRTPLNAIIGLSELILDNDQLPEAEKNNMEKIYSSGNHLLRLINDILDISKIEAGKLELYLDKYDLASLLNDIININVIQIEKKSIDFKLHLDENLPLNLYGDDLRVKQIFNNLLSNAFKYSNGGLVELSVTGEIDSTDSNYIWLNIRVKDDGVGIKEEELDKLFDNYTRLGYSSSRKQEGTGLGLSITKQLTEEMDGTIEVESVFGQGSVFKVKIRQQIDGEQVLGKEVVENLQNFKYTDVRRRNVAGFARSPMPYGKVLVVDDNLTNLYVFKNILAPYQITVHCVHSGLEAIEVIQQEKIIYDVIFMDHMMPDMDGIEATLFIREKLGTPYAKNVPIIACTANAIVGSQNKFLDNGFQGFLSKPIDVLALDHILKQWVRNKSLERRRDNPTNEQFHTLLKDESISTGDLLGELNTFTELAFDTPVESRVKVDIPGLNTEVCLELFNNNLDDYIKFITFFADNTRAKLENLKTVTKDSLHDYAVTVHGIKGSCAWIGADSVGKTAEKLEKSAMAGDLEVILTENPIFIQDMMTLIENIQEFCENQC